MKKSISEFFRKILKKILIFLSKWAINKHQIKVIVILGVNGTEILKELIYVVLSPEINVRRIINKPWWDFSVPLSILGYKDKKRNFFEWIYLIFRSIYYLLFGKVNPGSIIINLNLKSNDTMRFWADILIPNYLIVSGISNIDSRTVAIINNTVKNNGFIISKTQFKDINNYKNFKLATNLNHPSAKSLPFIPSESFELALATGSLFKLTPDHVITNALKIDISTLLSKIRTNLYKSE